jgi:hypothetical protein
LEITTEDLNVSNINYSINAEWFIGGNNGNDPPYVRLTDEQKMVIIKAIWDAVFSVEYHDEAEFNGSRMGDITLKETVFNEDGDPKTVHTVYDPNTDTLKSV